MIVQNGTIEAILLRPEGGSASEVHVNFFTQLVSSNVFENVEPLNAASLGNSRETVRNSRR